MKDFKNPCTPPFEDIGASPKRHVGQVEEAIETVGTAVLEYKRLVGDIERATIFEASISNSCETEAKEAIVPMTVTAHLQVLYDQLTANNDRLAYIGGMLNEKLGSLKLE